MSIKILDLDIKDIKFGSVKIVKIYLGDKLIWIAK